MNTSNNKITKIRKLANQNFRISRPYGIRLNLKKKTIILFNRELNMLGETDTGNLDTLLAEPYEYIENIPHSLTLQISQNDDRIDLYFYDNKTCPFKQLVFP